ncbi:MAG: DUF6428 family protein [Deinococcota bacterium]
MEYLNVLTPTPNTANSNEVTHLTSPDLDVAKPLQFMLNGKQLVPDDFHVTEVKRATIESLDCGHGAHSWQEIIVQLWSPSGKLKTTKPAMSGQKFLSILAKAKVGPQLEADVPLHIEFGNHERPAVQYNIAGIHMSDEVIKVGLEPPRVGCKPRTQQMAGLIADGASTSSCCTPQPAQASACCT